jgi:hypothetical protein
MIGLVDVILVLALHISLTVALRGLRIRPKTFLTFMEWDPRPVQITYRLLGKAWR